MVIASTTDGTAQPTPPKEYPHADQPTENMNQDAWRHPPPTDEETADMAENIWRYDNLANMSPESIHMFDVWSYILGNEEMSTSSGTETTPSQEAALHGQVFSTSTESAVGVFSTSTHTVSSSDATTTPSQRAALQGFQALATKSAEMRPAPSLLAPFNMQVPPVPPNSPEKTQAIDLSSAGSAGSTVQQVLTNRRIPAYTTPTVPIAFTQPLQFDTSQDSASLGLPSQDGSSLGNPPDNSIPESYSTQWDDNTDDSGQPAGQTQDDNTRDQPGPEVFDVDPPPDQRWIYPNTPAPASQPLGVMTVSAGLTWKNWTMISIGFAAILFSTIDMNTLPKDIDSAKYGGDVQKKTKGMLNEIYESSAQVITDIKNLTPHDLAEIKMMGSIVGSLMITWGFCEHQIGNLMGNPNFRQLGNTMIFDPLRSVAALPRVSAGWGKAMLMTPGVTAFVLAYWKSPTMARWVKGGTGFPTMPYDEVMNLLQPDNQLDWELSFMEKVAEFGDAGLVAYEGMQMLNNNYGRHTTLSLVYLAVMRPYTYGLYLSGPTKEEILNWTAQKAMDQAGFDTNSDMVTRAQNGLTKALRNYVLASETFKKIKKTAQNTIGVVAMVAVLGAAYLYS